MLRGPHVQPAALLRRSLSPELLVTGEVFVEPKGPEEGQLRKAPLAAVPQGAGRIAFPWPWGLVAIGVMALAWIGIYLLWNGIAFVFNW